MSASAVEPVCVAADQTITREQEQQLYAYLKREVPDEAPRYYAIATKIQRAAAGTATDWEWGIVKDWLDAMVEESRQAEEAARRRQPAPRADKPFESLRSGVCGNPIYQAFLNTLEQDGLDAIENNAPYFGWFSDRSVEANRLKVSANAHAREWSEANLSERVKALRRADAL